MVAVYIIIALPVLLLIIAATLPDKYLVEQTIIIKRPVPEVMDKVADLNFYSKWNPWQMRRSRGKMNVSGIPKTPGHQYKWYGRKNGQGSLTLRSIDRKHVHFDVQFIKPWKSAAKDNWLFEEWGSDETKVTWANNGNLPFPFARLMGQSIYKNLNRRFAKGLKNLKKMCEG